MKYKIRVTEKHIRDGRKNFHTSQCPLGLALQAAGLPKGFEFNFNTVTIKNTAKFPKAARTFLNTLLNNQNAEIKPFTFELEF